MFREGEMARVSDAGRVVKICSISNDVAECIWFDSRGNLFSREYDIAALNPFWLQARSLWPEINQIPDEVVAQSEEAAAQRRTRSKRPCPSMRIKKSRTP